MTTPLSDPRIARGMKKQLAARAARIAAGETPLGWKVAFGAPAMLEKLKLSAPLVGFLMQRALVPTDASVSLHGWTKPVAEPEIAVHMGRDLGPSAAPKDVAAAIAALAPAIELADVDIAPTEQTVEAILAGDIYQRHVVLGSTEPRRAGGSTQGLTARVLRNATLHAMTDDPETNTGKLVDIVSHVATVLAASGERLKAGDVIIAGSVVASLFLEASDHSFALELNPIGAVAVHVTH